MFAIILSLTPDIRLGLYFASKEIDAVNSKCGISKEALGHVITADKDENFAVFENTIRRNIKMAHYKTFKGVRPVILTSKKTKPKYEKELDNTNIPKNVEIESGESALRHIQDCFHRTETAFQKS